MTIRLYPHQEKALNDIRNGSIVRGGVGTGKSITAIAYFFVKECLGKIPINGEGRFEEMEMAKDLYIITTAKKRDGLDWIEELAPFGLGKERDASFDGVKVTVDSWNNINNYKDVKDAFFIFDEQRLVGSGSWVKSFIAIAKTNRWIMLSATPGDNWMDYIPVFIANGFYKNRTEFLRRHVVYKNFSKFPKVDHYVETGHLDRLRRQILVDMPYERHTTRHTEHIHVDHDEVLFNKLVKERWHVYEDRPIKDVGELFRVMRKVVNSDSSRIEAVKQLMREHDKLIIFYNFNYELDELRKLTESIEFSDRAISEWNGKKHQEIPKTDKWVYLVQYAAGAEGWNCVDTDAIAFFSLNYSYKIFEQAKGRIDRLNTPFTDLYYYVFRSKSQIDNAIWKSVIAKQNFNELKYLKKHKEMTILPERKKDVNGIFEPEEWPVGSKEEHIHRLRRQVLVHSIMYYKLNENVVPDIQFDAWAYELAELQRENPEESSRVEYHNEAFKGFTGETGAFLPLDDIRATAVAKQLIKSREKGERNEPQTN